MAAQFILSLDCEGKWGAADHLKPWHHQLLSDQRLELAYTQIVQLLDEWAIPATFAFVGLFAEPKASFRRLLPLIEGLRQRAPYYLGPAMADISEGSEEGWHGSWAIDMVGAANTGHEIALHGVTHVPWSSESEEFFQQEMNLFRQLSSPVTQSKTFVFPRNRVDHLSVLRGAGFLAYRGAPSQRSRLRSLASEFNLWAQPEKRRRDNGDGILEIPAGYFVNLRRGLRNAVPKRITRERFRRLLDRAIDGRVVHAWLHPENVASSPDTLNVLRDIIELVAERRQSGTCDVVTQIGFTDATAGVSPVATN